MQVAEEELQRELSNAGTDKFSDDEPIVFPVEGYRESICETSKANTKYFEDDDAAEAYEVPRDTGSRGCVKNEGSKSKTCTVQ